MTKKENKIDITAEQLFPVTSEIDDKEYWCIGFNLGDEETLVSCIKNNIIFRHHSEVFIKHCIEELESFDPIQLILNENKKSYYLSVENTNSSYTTHSRYQELNEYLKDRSYEDKLIFLVANFSFTMISDPFFIELQSPELSHFNKRRLRKVDEIFIWLDSRFGSDWFEIVEKNRNLAVSSARSERSFKANEKTEKALDDILTTSKDEIQEKVQTLTIDTDNPFNMWKKDVPREFIYKFEKNIRSDEYKRIWEFFETFDLKLYIPIMESYATFGSVIIPLYCFEENKTSAFFASAIAAVTYKSRSLKNFKTPFEPEEDQDIFFAAEGIFNSAKDYTDLVEDPDAKCLKELAAIGENTKIEYKTQVRYDQPYNKKDQRFKYHYHEIIREICAFANRKGGKILVGYHEKSKNFMGIRVTDKTITNEKNGRKGKKNEDMENMDDKSFCDRWELYIRNHLYNLTQSSMVTNLVNFEFLKMNDLLFAVIHVEMLPIPEDFIECKHLITGRRVIYMREGALARRLQGNEPIELSRKRNMGQLD